MDSKTPTSAAPAKAPAAQPKPRAPMSAPAPTAPVVVTRQAEFKKIEMRFVTGAKNVVLHIWQDRALVEDALIVLGQSRAAAFLKELLSLGDAAVTAYEDSAAVEIDPATILKLLPDMAKLEAPAASEPAAPVNQAK